MKPKKSNLLLQREVIEKKLRPWISIRHDRRPNSGWIKAIRGALGMTAKQLADRMEIAQPNVVAFENREAKGTITLEVLEKAAQAMDCKLVYAIVPNDGYLSIDELLTQKSEEVAKAISKGVSHSMALEAQGLTPEDQRSTVSRLAKELKEKMDSRIWDSTPRKGKKS
jgi:hypothetical protein